MTVLDSADLVLVGAVALAHAGQMALTASRVGDLRRKHKIAPPSTEGPPEFVRALRAQQNSLEFGVAFEIVLWVAGIFGHPVPASALGAVYVYSRHNYINGYIEDAEKRIKPFWMGIRSLKGLSFLALAGLVNVSLKHYASIDVINIAKQRLF